MARNPSDVRVINFGTISLRANFPCGGGARKGENLLSFRAPPPQVKSARRLWNDLTLVIRNAPAEVSFKSKLTNHLTEFSLLIFCS